MKIIIRKAQANDAKSLLDYVNQVSGESDNLTFGKGEFKLSVQEEIAFIETLNQTDNAIYLIALDDEKIVGSLNFSPGSRKRIEHKGEFGISVLKDYWGKGIGTSLMNSMLDWAKNTKKIRKLNLRVRTDNYHAISLYKKFGFEIEGCVSREFQIDNQFYDTYFMGLKI